MHTERNRKGRENAMEFSQMLTMFIKEELYKTRQAIVADI